MYGRRNTMRMDADHFKLLADHGEQVALVTALNLDEGVVVGVYSFHRYGDTYAIESSYPATRGQGEVDTHYELVGHESSAALVVAEWLDEVITNQENSDEDARFTWRLETAVNDVSVDGTVQEHLGKVVGPERLEPDFDIPNEDRHAVLNLSTEGHELLKQANGRAGWADIDIHRHRGKTHVVGLTPDRARTLSNAVHDLQQEFSQNGLYESAETADAVETRIFDAASAVSEEV